ncbi:MAG: LysR family transcriptional regulator [Sneathiella sp.]
MNFTLRQLETFVWVATLGNFRKTAEQLNTTQPAISNRISGLENLLGVRLFERDTGSVKLTAKGQELLPYAEKVIRSARQFHEHTGNSVTMSGVLRLGVSESIVHAWLSDFLAALHALHPDIDVEITVLPTCDLRDELVARSLDLAFLMGPVSEYRIENVDLSSMPLCWAASPKLGIQKSSPLSIDEMISFPLLTYPRNTRPYVELEKFLREQSDLPPARLFPSSSLSACLQMAVDGIGIVSLPYSTLAKHAKDGSLIEISCEWTPPPLHFTASYPSVPPNPVSEIAASLARDIAQR